MNVLIRVVPRGLMGLVDRVQVIAPEASQSLIVQFLVTYVRTVPQSDLSLLATRCRESVADM